MNVRFLNDGNQRLVGGPTSLEKRWEVAALAQLGNSDGQSAQRRVPRPLAIAVALVRSGAGSFSVGGARQALDIEIHHAVDDEIGRAHV